MCRIIILFHYVCRSVDYTINDRHQFHLVVTAQVVPVALELSSDKITLKPAANMAAESGKNEKTIRHNLYGNFFVRALLSPEGTSDLYLFISGFRGVIAIKNKRNHAADFTWKALNCKDGTSFSIRPAKGKSNTTWLDHKTNQPTN